MKLNVVTIVIAVFIILFVALGVQTYRANRLKEGKRIAEEELSQAIQVANDKSSKLELFVNAYNNEAARSKALTLSLNNVEDLRNSERLKFLAQFAGLKKNLRNLETAGSFEWLILEDSIPAEAFVIPCPEDSIKGVRFKLFDEFNTIDIVAADTPRIEIRVPFYTSVYWQRKNKFLGIRYGKKEYNVESYSPNKLIKITKQDLVRVEKR